MNKICTSIKQSEKLIELGIDVNTADMFYADLLINGKHKYNPHLLESYEFKTFEETKVHTTDHLGFIPAWSLTALLNILAEQHFIIKSSERNDEYQYNIDIPSRHCKIWFSSLLDAAFEMICWLKENNKL